MKLFFRVLWIVPALLLIALPLGAQEEDCLPCHECLWDVNKLGVYDEGVSNKLSPPEWESPFDCYPRCPYPEECEDTDDSPTAQLAEALLVLGEAVEPGVQGASPISTDLFWATGVQAIKPVVSRSRCRTRIVGLPRFVDLIPNG